jgi:DNA-binding CsgD family transcriptional regulator
MRKEISFSPAATYRGTPWREVCTSVEALESERTVERLFERLMEQLESVIAFDYALVALARPDNLRAPQLFLSRHADFSEVDRYLGDSISIDPVLPGIPLQPHPLSAVDWKDHAGNDLARALLERVKIRYSLNLSNMNRSPEIGFIASVHRGGRFFYSDRESGFMAALFPHVDNLYSTMTSPSEHRASARTQECADAAGLTSREREVLLLLVERLSTFEIADRLCISPRTVGTHLDHIYSKLAVAGRRGVWDLIQARESPRSFSLP